MADNVYVDAFKSRIRFLIKIFGFDLKFNPANDGISRSHPVDVIVF